MILRHKLIVTALFSALSLSTAWAQQDVTVRIPELENNTEYLDLLRSDARMRQKSDSLMSAIRDIRSAMSRNAEERDSLAQMRTDSLSVILSDTENAVYAMRSQMIKLVDRINAIEQEHLLASMGNIGGATEKTSGSIFTNAYFRKSIDPDDYTALMAANAKEAAAYKHAQTYVSNYEKIKQMHEGLLEHYKKVIPGEAQQLMKIRSFWDYMEPTIGRKQWKKIIKAGNMKNYLLKVNELTS